MRPPQKSAEILSKTIPVVGGDADVTTADSFCSNSQELCIPQRIQRPFSKSCRLGRARTGQSGTVYCVFFVDETVAHLRLAVVPTSVMFTPKLTAAQPDCKGKS
uniref:Uncharacterized protein n=1 Tax=Octactis speculum TaxID=3111310 RepID=A0A7S2MCJ5_9STRA|mmetsp:Transcript_59535/g.81342  ORF Transcript_59535/g.81342 Transcript_59535/m.81342 type:complete len:104 (+) Transcript_59535:138-449(+)